MRGRKGQRGYRTPEKNGKDQHYKEWEFFFRERKAIYALRGEGSIIEILLVLLNVSCLPKSIKYIANNVMSQSIFQ